jgi:hypothetical protein
VQDGVGKLVSIEGLAKEVGDAALDNGQLEDLVDGGAVAWIATETLYCVMVSGSFIPWASTRIAV